MQKFRDAAHLPATDSSVKNSFVESDMGFKINEDQI